LPARVRVARPVLAIGAAGGGGRGCALGPGRLRQTGGRLRATAGAAGWHGGAGGAGEGQPGREAVWAVDVVERTDAGGARAGIRPAAAG
jgi:hypothetical protein